MPLKQRQSSIYFKYFYPSKHTTVCNSIAGWTIAGWMTEWMTEWICPGWMHPLFIKENKNSHKTLPVLPHRTLLVPPVVNKCAVVNKWTVVNVWAVVNVWTGEGGVKSSRVVSVCIHIQPLKKIQSSRGFYPPGLHLLCTIRCQFMTSLLWFPLFYIH